jgi:hypothetical protein
MSGASNVTDLAEHRDRAKKAVQAQLDEALEDARQAATHVFFEALGGLLTPKTELRMVVGVTYGDPTAEITLNEAVFFALDGQLPIDDDHRFSIALGVVKAVDEEAFERLEVGIDVAAGLAALQDASDAGDTDAGQRLHQLLNIAPPHAGGVHDSGEPTPS